MVDVVLRTEYGRSSSPKIRFIKLLFPEPVSPVKITSYQYIKWDWSHLELTQENNRTRILIQRRNNPGNEVKKTRNKIVRCYILRDVAGYCVKIGPWSGSLLAKFKISVILDFFVQTFIKTYRKRGPQQKVLLYKTIKTKSQQNVTFQGLYICIKCQQVHSNKQMISLVEKYEKANWSLRKGDEEVNNRIEQKKYWHLNKFQGLQPCTSTSEMFKITLWLWNVMEINLLRVKGAYKLILSSG